jgi:hypothetical protein
MNDNRAMEIRIGNTSDFLLIKDIVPEGQVLGYNPASIEFLRGTIQLQMNGLASNIDTCFILGELKQFLTDLQKLHDTLKYSFLFKNLEDNIELTFTPTPNGQIELKGLLRNRNYTGSVNFEIEIDQSYLPGLITNLKETLDQIKEI